MAVANALASPIRKQQVFRCISHTDDSHTFALTRRRVIYRDLLRRPPKREEGGCKGLLLRGVGSRLCVGLHFCTKCFVGLGQVGQVEGP